MLDKEMNPAARLLKIYDLLISQNKDQVMSQTWAEVFGLDASSPTLEDDVTACIVALRAEVDFARLRLAAHDVPSELTSPGFDRLKDVASPGCLRQSWNSLRGNVQPPECRHAFTWSNWVLRDDGEDDIPDDDMNEVAGELASLEAALRDSEMSSYLRDFVQRQVDTIRAALRIYGVQGARPLCEAMRKVVGDINVEGERLRTENAAAPDGAKGVLAKTAEIIDKTAKVCDNIDKIRKFGEGAQSLAKTIGPLLLPYLSKINGG